MKPVLSKSRLIRGLQCRKSLWLMAHRPELREVSDGTEAVFRQGHNVGDLARDLFPGGVLIPFDGLSYEEQVSRTREAVARGKVVYEGAFYHNGVFVKADILRKTRSGWELYEIKASTKVSDVHLDDVAVQYHVITNAGLPLKKVFVGHIDNSYVRQGELELGKLFKLCDVTEEAKGRQAAVKRELAAQKRMLAGGMPDLDIGPHCDSPYGCDFKSHCWEHIPSDSIFSLAGKGIDKFALYGQGIVRLRDIPAGLLKGKQLQQAQLAKTKEMVCQSEQLRSFLGKLSYPLCFLDFETFMEAVPSHDGQRPYQQIPFQYSLHYLKRKGGKLHHREFLAEPGIDPRKPLLESLLNDIPEGACILAYWKSFEEGRLKELVEVSPWKKAKVKHILDRMVDLIEPFQKRHLYSWKQKGSHSIKAVLPAFVEGMSYEGMEIGDGGAAMEAYHEMCAAQDDPQKLADIRRALLEYCRQDTLAMVKLVDVIAEKSRA